MFRSRADKTFLKGLAMTIVGAEILVVGVCYAIFGEPYWSVMAIIAGAAVFGALIGFSVLFSPDFNAFDPKPAYVRRLLSASPGPGYPGYGPHEDPRARAARESEAAERMKRDERAAEFFASVFGKNRRESRTSARVAPHLRWVFGPLAIVSLVIAALLWGGASVAS